MYKDFEEFELHISKFCKRDSCFYCKEEDDMLEQEYKYAKKLGQLKWEDLDRII